MANSRDPRRPTRFHRGSKRYGNVGGHSPPDDTLENTRDHERIWFELRHKRGCCGCEHPGLKYCFETADYPTLVCEGFYPASFALIDYWPGHPLTSLTDDMTLGQGCGGTGNTTVEGFSTLVEFQPDGSWRNGPIFGKRGFGGNGTFLGTGTGWNSSFWMEASWSFEYFIKPSSTDFALAKSLTASGPFMNVGDGGLFTNFAAGGAISAQQLQMNGGALITSAQGVFTADEWHHVVYTYGGAGDGGFSVYVNGTRVIFGVVPPADLSYNTDVVFTFGLGEGSWSSDVSRYSGVMPASEIRRRARVMLGVVGIPDGEDEEGGDGTIVEDPTFLIVDLGPDQIAGSGSYQDVLLSAGDTAYWETPEGSPFELEERKSQPDGYASLDSTTKVPTAELGTGAASALGFLRGDRAWVDGELIDPPEELSQIIRAEPTLSSELLARLDVVFPAGQIRYPLTESGSPFAPSSGSFGNLVAAGSPTIIDDADEVYGGETVVRLNGGTDGLASVSSPSADIGRSLVGVWIKVHALPASNVTVVRAGAGTFYALQLRSDGKLDLYVNSVLRLTSATALVVDEWTYVMYANDGAGTGTGTKLWINGVADATGLAVFGSSSVQLVVGGDGIEASFSHLHWVGFEWSSGNLTDAEVLYLYESRRPIWTLMPDSVGVEASENGVDVTAAPRARLDFIPAGTVSVDVVDNSAADVVEVTIGGGGVEASEGGVDVTAAARKRIDFIPGSNVSLDVVDNSGGDVIEVTIAATAPAGSGIEVSEGGVDATASPRGRLDFIAGSNILLDVVDNGGGDVAEITIAATSGGGSGWTYETRSSNTILGSSDASKAIDLTASITQTFDDAATLGVGWAVILRNATDDGTTVITLDPDTTETIDGVTTPRLYSGETRLIVCDGTNFHSFLLTGGFAKFTADGTFYVPAGAQEVIVECVGGGGGGGAGRGSGGAALEWAGNGGGGGARTRKVLAIDRLGAPGASVTVDVGAGGSGGTAGGNGVAGSPTTFGSTLVVAYGGGLGGGTSSGGTGARVGGAGGGFAEVGANGGNVTTATLGGCATTAGAIGTGGAGGGGGTTIGAPAEYGGGGGGPINGTGLSGGAGGSSMFGGGGGGGGGGVTTGDALGAGADGGGHGEFIRAGGGGGAGGAAGVNGTAGAYGEGGGGGGGSLTLGGDGGAGGAAGGGGGGGGGGNTAGQGGDGGAGGTGECLVWFK